MTVSRNIFSASSSNSPQTPPRLSASLMLLCPLSKQTADGYNYKILLLQRRSGKGSFQSASVFPGGNLDPADEQYASSGPKSEKLLALKLCAVRETFEECGILIGSSSESTAAMQDDERVRLRKKLYENPSTFQEMFSLNDPVLDQLAYRSNWITPRMIHFSKRFDTHFFAYLMPPSQASDTQIEPVASSDGSETTSAIWYTPREAINKALGYAKKAPGSILLFPPQFYLLAELLNTPDWRQLCPDGKAIASRDVVPYEPSPVQTSQEGYNALTLPGDEEYPLESGINCKEGQVHRTIVDTKAGKGFVIVGQQRQGIHQHLSDYQDFTVGSMYSSKL